MKKQTTLIAKPQRPVASAAALDAFVSGAPDAGGHQVAAQAAAPVEAAAPAAELPRSLRKRKEPITVTVDPQILGDFDGEAGYLGLSRAGALGMAMKLWVEEQRKRRAGR